MAKKTGIETTAFPVEVVAISSLKPHPRNYKAHPQDQIEHLTASIRAHGLYRNIVIARDDTILAGHGVVQAARATGITDVPALRLDLDPHDPRALKVLAGDNEVMHLGENDDRALSELLKEVMRDDPTGLLGTGYDEMMLANLVMVTRPASEIADFDEAAQWAGMPEYENADAALKVIISFRSETDRAAYVEQTHLRIDKREAKTWTTRWPWTDREDLASQHFEG